MRTKGAAFHLKGVRHPSSEGGDSGEKVKHFLLPIGKYLLYSVIWFIISINTRGKGSRSGQSFFALVSDLRVNFNLGIWYYITPMMGVRNEFADGDY